MLEMQAVIGRIQLHHIADWTLKRNANAAILANALKPFASTYGSIRIPQFRCNGKVNDNKSACTEVRDVGDIDVCTMGCIHAYYKFYAYLQPQNLNQGWTQSRIIETINDYGVPCSQGSCSEVYLEKAFEGTEWRPPERLSTARELGDTSLMFLVHPTLTKEEIAKTCIVIKHVMSEASKIRTAI